MNSEKQLIRKKHIIARNAISPKQKAHLDKKIINHLLQLLAGKQKISIFYPIGSEINLLPLCNLKPNLTFLFPKIKKDILIFHHPKNIAKDFEYNQKYKIYEPLQSSDILIPEIIICPMLSFDLNKNRLGYGGGFYDRTISFLRKANKITYIGVAYNTQQYELIPTSSQDQPLDIIVTEQGQG